MDEETKSTDLTEVTSGFQAELAKVNIADGVVQHLQSRTRQYQELETVNMFGYSAEDCESRRLKPGDHPLVQILKFECERYARSLHYKRLYDQALETGAMRQAENLQKEIMGARTQQSSIGKIIDIAKDVSKMADQHFAREIQMWMEHAKMVTAKELTIEEAAQQLVKQDKSGTIDYETALSILEAQQEEDDGEAA